jgi:nitrate reductase gamma subunit
MATLGGKYPMAGLRMAFQGTPARREAYIFRSRRNGGVSIAKCNTNGWLGSHEREAGAFRTFQSQDAFPGGMAMTLALYLVFYLAVVVFVVACVARVLMYARTPLHLRWELYPVPHEDPKRVKHGGSYFEEKDWWTKPAKFNLMGEMSFMVPEMLFLKALHEFNRKLWLRSFPFHFGLYLLMGTCGLVLAAALLGIFAPALAAGTLGLALHWLYTVVGVIGVALAIVGAIGLLHRRLTDEKLKTYTTPGDLFNLIFFLVAFGVLAAGYATRAPGSPGTVAFVQGLLTFNTSMQVSGLMAAGLILCALLAAYIPLTHMSHFIGKYFTYHSVRWSDSPNIRGGKIEKKLMEYLTYRPTWSAAHIGGDGKKTWADIATTNPWEGSKK